jgi:hypothetical protein
MAGLGQDETIVDSRLRERRLRQHPQWEEIELRLRCRWAPERVIRWLVEKCPGEPHPSKMTLFRFVKSKPDAWFIAPLLPGQTGTRSVPRQLVVQRQSELLELQVMRVAGARQVELAMDGLLIPEVGRQIDLLDRMYLNHFRTQQELGLEPKHGSMIPNAAPAGETGTTLERAFIQKIVDLPSDDFLAVMHRHFEDRRAKAPLQPGEVIDIEARSGHPVPGSSR